MKRLLAAAALVVPMTVSAQAAPSPEQPPKVQALYETLMEATVNNKVEDFHGACDEDVRAAVTPEKLASVSTAVKPVLAPGYETDYLGSYRKTGLDVHLYRVDPKAADDDVLVVLAVRGERCAGFLLQ
jgi:hypothetical protein